MKKQAKKGFTIVELVIVIALIAILAAVLIPTFSNVINNAHESSDTMMVKNLNTILNTEEINGNGAKTMQDAIDQAEAGGYKVEKLTPTSSGDIVWDQKSNRFLLINAKKQVVYKDDSVTGDIDPEKDAYKLWKITHDATKEDKGYSLYLADGAVVPAGEVEVGIDVGVNANVAVNFKSEAAREVIIRTNGGTLNVDAKNATVSHYGEAEKVVIAAVAGNSYHEHGKVVGNIEIAKGRVVMETGSAASAIKVTATKEEVTNGAKVVVDTKTSNVAVVVPAEVKDEIIAKGGSINAADDKVVTDTTVIANMDKFAGGLGTAESPYLIATAEQLKNVADFSEEMKTGKALSFKLIADIDLSTEEFNTDYVSTYFCGDFDGDNKILIVSDVLKGIFGSAVGNTEFANIKLRLFSNPVKLCSGMNVYSSTNLVLDNIEIDTAVKGDYVKLGKNNGLFFNGPGYDDVTEKWCDNHRNSIVISNCKGYANITAESYNAVFIGAMLNNTDATVKNSVYYGQYYGESVNLVYGNTCSDSGSGWNSYGKSIMTIENVRNEGAIYGTKRAALFAGGAGMKEASEHTTIKNCSIGTTRALTDSTLAVSLNADKNIVVKKATAQSEYYVLTFVGGRRRVTEFAENSSYRFNIKLETPVFDDNGQLVTAYKPGKMVTVEQYKTIDTESEIVKGSGAKLYGESGAEYWVKEYNGEVYYVFSFENSYYHFESAKGVSGPAEINSVLVTIYDAEDKPIAQKNCSVK